MLISAGIVYGAFWFFERQEKAAGTLAQKYPLAVGVHKEPPTPNLQNQPFKDIYLLRQERNREADQLWLGRQGRRRHAHSDRSRHGSDAAAGLSRRAPTAATH